MNGRVGGVSHDFLDEGIRWNENKTFEDITETVLDIINVTETGL